MLIVNTSVSGAFSQLHHSPFLTDRITFADVPASQEVLTYSRRYSQLSFSVQASHQLSPNRLLQNFPVEQSS